ncbi:cytochrome P450 11B, mitochondrial [Cheilinus undulatus]|uniref:cytochrome P450 11B, mitochondrial n=1 Tax=Cheilinus undulatus TaxID=241271 RepID=UPI001BD5CC06|nr:cytochrome P450 11B, mitochondrial [Cheilinus undulatus]
MNAQKNAERAAMRAHFRRKYQLSEDYRDTNHLRSVGGRVSLPHELLKIIHPESKSKDNGFNLLKAFQGLSLGTETFAWRKHNKTSTPTPARENTYHTNRFLETKNTPQPATTNRIVTVSIVVFMTTEKLENVLIALEHIQGYEVVDGGGKKSVAEESTVRTSLTGNSNQQTHFVWIKRSMFIGVTVSFRAQGALGSRNLCGVKPQRSLCMTTADTVVEGKSERRKGSDSAGASQRRVGEQVKSFDEIPHTGRSGWVNLVKFWREDRFRQLHKHMEKTFSALGPIYREHVGTHSSVNIMLPSDISELFRSEGLHPRRMTLQPWATHRETRQQSKGVFLKNGEEWRADRLLLNKEVMMTAAVKRFLPLLDEVASDFCRMLQTKVEREGRGEKGRRSLTMDPSPDLFRFALEASCHVIYGERIGLFSSSPSMESQKFIWAVERMLATTPPLLYLPPRLLLRIGAPLWTQHASAWDHIFSHAEARIQRGYHRLSSSKKKGSENGAAGGQYTGVLGQLLEKGQLSQDLIKANITELMAGGVDTTAMPLQFALFELGRNPEVQERVRQQVRASWAQAEGDPQKALQGAPLLKGTIKETLRLYPVGTTVQRYPVKDIILQNYHIPAGTMVQACLYPMGRSAEVFEDPQRFYPGRWGSSKEEGMSVEGAGFRSLAFGFGARQCVGRRIAENEMQLLLMHILLSFHLSVSSSEDIKTTCTLILQPETPPRITFRKL